MIVLWLSCNFDVIAVIAMIAMIAMIAVISIKQEFLSPLLFFRLAVLKVLLPQVRKAKDLLHTSNLLQDPAHLAIPLEQESRAVHVSILQGHHQFIKMTRAICKTPHESRMIPVEEQLAGIFRTQKVCSF